MPTVLRAAFIAAYFLFLAHQGLTAYFSADDVMNIYHAWAIPWSQLLRANLLYFSTESRPLPGLIYRLLHAVFGFHPLPFRILCFCAILANLWLLQRFARRLSGSDEIAWLATLLAAYHAWLVDIYYNTSTLEELGAYFFYFSAFLYYVRIRQTGGLPTGLQLAGLAALFIAALDSKETALTLPVLVAAYELLLAPAKDRRRWIAPLALGAVAMPYILSRLMAPGGRVSSHPLYRLDISPDRYLNTFHLYLNVLFYQDHWFGDAKTVQLLFGMAAVAWFLRRSQRHLWFCLAWTLVSVLPFIFLQHHSGFFMYLPMAGWAIYLATLIHVGTGKRATAGVLVAVAAFLLPVHLAERRVTEAIYLGAQAPVEEFVRTLEAIGYSPPKAARLLVRNDPFKKEDYTLLFTTALYYGDPMLTVHREPDGGPYDRVIDFRVQ